MLKYKYKVLSLRRIIFGMGELYLIYTRIILINIRFMNTTFQMPDHLFEVSWEVCNKVGGIHTVSATKSLTVGKLMGDGTAMKAGLGCYAVQVGSLQVGAMVVVNAIGDVFELDSDHQLAGLLNRKKNKMISSEVEAVKLLQLASKFSFNTTIGAIVTNANLDKASMNKVAAMASNGVARTIRPVNTSMDGDSIYAMSVGKVKSSADVVGTLAAYVLGRAINRAVLEAEEKYGYKSAQSFLPKAKRK